MDEQTTEQPIVEAAMRMDWEDYRECDRFYRRQQKAQYILMCVLLLFLALYGSFCFSQCVYHGDLGPWIRYDFLFWFSLVLFLLLAVGVAYLIWLFAASRFRFKKQTELLERGYRISFFEDHLLVVHDGPMTQETVEVKYEYYTEAIETDYAFYLRKPRKKLSYAMHCKKYLTPAQQESLRALYTRTFGEKFKTIK